MISKQPRNDSGIDASASIGTPGSAAARWTSIRSLVIPLRAPECNGRKNARCRTRQSQKWRYGVAPSVAFGLGTANRLYLIICMSPSTTRQTAAFRPSVTGLFCPICGNSGPESFRKSCTHNFYGTDSDYDDSTTDTATCVLSTTSTITPPFATLRVGARKAGLPDDGDYGWSVEYYPPASDVNSWTWSRTANTKDVITKFSPTRPT